MTIRRTLVSCVAGAVALFLVLAPATPQAQGQGQGQGQQGGVTALQAQVQALEQTVADLSEALSELGIDVQGLQQLLSDVNTALNTAQGDISDLKARVLELEADVAALGGGLTSYDALAGQACTTALGTQGSVNLVGLQKSPICANAVSANGRFIDFGLVVVDTQTNLLWEKKTTAVGSGQNLADLHDVDNTYDWFTATGNWIAAVNAEGFAGFTNWRVPTRDELLTIVDMNTGPPRIDPIFGPTQASRYWSSTLGNNDLFQEVWAVHFETGHAGSESEFLDLHVRAVRSGS